MEPTTFGTICQYIGADAGSYAELDIAGISTDSRTIKPGELFLPLAGERFDGHDFIATAFYAGAAAAVVSQPVADKYPHVMVPDTRAAYLAIAAGYRRRFSPVVVGVTGSVGKTTTKEMIASVLSQRYVTLKNEGNLNNTLGLPATILNLTSEHGAAIFEMGMSSLGEISQLSKTAQPDIAVITNIGFSHIGYLGSRERIRQAKLEITDGMRENGKLILNGDEPLLWELRRTLPQDILYFGIENDACDLTANPITPDENAQNFTIRGKGRRLSVHLPAIGQHQVYNALAAAAVGIAAKLDDTDIIEGLASFTNTGMRQNIYFINGYKIIEDCYNASPDSMKAALEVLDVQTGGKRAAVLGAMLELGEYAKTAHEEIGMRCAACADYLFVCGKHAEDYARGALDGGMDRTHIQMFDTQEGMAETLAEKMQAGDILLFKGSRSTRMETVLEAFKKTVNNT